MASTLRQHRLSFAVAPDEHLAIHNFSFYTQKVVQKHLKTACFRMAARRNLSWNWKEDSKRLSVSTVSAHAQNISLMYLKREEFLLSCQMLGCMLVMPTILKTEAGRGLKIVDGILNQGAKDAVLDSLRLGSIAIRQFSVNPDHVSSLNLPKSLYGFGAFAMNVCASMINSSVAYRTGLKVQGLSSDRFNVSESIAFEAIQLLESRALAQLGVSP